MDKENASRMSEVNDQFTSLENTVSRIGEAIKELGKRLESVITPKAEVGCGGENCPKPVLCPLANRINLLNDQAMKIENSIGVLRKSIEL